MSHSEVVKGDPRNRYFSMGSTDEPKELILEPEIPEAVSEGVRQLLSLADQTFVSSFFFYDLCHASLLWTAIAAEAALGERFAQKVGPRAALFKKGKTNEVEVRDWSSLEWLLRKGWRAKAYPRVATSFVSLAEWAFQEGFWPPSFEPTVREGLIPMRNMMAHATRRSLMPPGPIELGRWIVGLGAVLVVVGLLVWVGGLSWFGRLPGDIRIERETVRIYLPIVSMLLISAVLSVLYALARRFF